MTEVEHVALWAGLIASIVGIALSIVAILFTISVEKSNRAVAEQTTKTLRKIESEVDRTSQDMRELIRVGWNKMLGVSDGHGPQSLESSTSYDAVASGMTSELRSELGSPHPENGEKTTVGESERIEEILRNFEQDLRGQFEAAKASRTPGAAFDRVYATVESMSEEARGLALMLAYDSHLEKSEYQKLLKGPLRSAVRELRGRGLLVPVQAHQTDELGPCYWFHPALFEYIRPALALMDEPSAQILSRIDAELRRIGYKKEALEQPARSKGK
jgi:hypothetical protein